LLRRNVHYAKPNSFHCSSRHCEMQRHRGSAKGLDCYPDIRDRSQM